MLEPIQFFLLLGVALYVGNVETTLEGNSPRVSLHGKGIVCKEREKYTGQDEVVVYFDSVDISLEKLEEALFKLERRFIHVTEC